MSEAFPAFTPVNVLTGFLGSGKTTLLQRLLRSPLLHDTAVLINEFGEVGLDHHLLERVDETTVLLQSGCLCCTIRGDLSKAMRELHSKRDQGVVPAFRRLVIETTGLADPLPVLTTVTADPVLCHHYRLGNVITTLDAVNGQSHLDRQPESLKQCAVADRIVITKTDLTTTQTVNTLAERVRRFNHSAQILMAPAQEDQAGRLLSQDVFDIDSKTEEVRRWFAQEARAGIHTGHRHDPNRHGDDIQSFCLVFDDPLDWTDFGLWLTMLLNRHGTEVLRVKGILNVAGESAPVAVHGVQQLVHPPVHMERWPDADHRSKLVFITQGLEPSRVRRSLMAFMGKIIKA
ncbi:MAG: GTP-binding protein [Betaproteobacteria bacterium]|nr:GTP-binding protein [Betaproteobacteria bacterium]